MMFKGYDYYKLLEKTKNVVDDMIELLDYIEPRWKKLIEVSKHRGNRFLLEIQNR